MATSTYRGALRRQWRVVAIVVLAAVAAALITTALQDKRYRSTTRMIVSEPTGPIASVIAAQVADLSRFPRARSAAVVVADQLANRHVELSHPAVSASASGALVIISVSADSADAARALAASYPAA